MNDKEDYNKVSFDGRQYFYPNVFILWREVDKAIIMHDVNLYCSCLIAIYRYVHPYMKKADSIEIQSDLDLVVNRLESSIDNRFRKTYDNKSMRLLNNIGNKLSRGTKDMNVPTGGTEDEEVDWEAIKTRGHT